MSSRYLTIVLSLLFVSVTGVFLYARSVFFDLVDESFLYSSQEFARQIESRAEIPIHVVVGLRGLFLSSEAVNRREFRDSVDFSANKEGGLYRGVKSISYLTRVLPEDTTEFTLRNQFDTSILPGGYPNFHIYPQTEAVEYYVITYIEPQSDQIALGFDARSETERRRALEWARDQDEVSISRPVQLIEQQEAKTAFLVSAPLYSEDVFTRQERRDALSGFVQVSLFYDELLQDIMDYYTNVYGLGFRLYDVDPVSGDRVLISEHRAAEPGTPDYTISLTIADRVWEVETYMPDNYQGRRVVNLLWWLGYIMILSISVGGFVSAVWVGRLRKQIGTQKEIVLRLQREISQQRTNKELEQALSNLEQEKQRAEEKTSQLERLNKMMVNRELRMAELKEEIVRLRGGVSGAQNPGAAVGQKDV